jgi:hypothetical protein
VVNLFCEAWDLPTSLSIGGREYKIAVDWKTWAKITAVSMSEKSDAERVSEMLLLCYGKNMPSSLSEACVQMMWFYARGKRDNKDSSEGNQNRKIFDIEYDFPLISAAFMSQYGIDLRQSVMHWWRFWELFDGLDDNEKIIKVIGWRAAKTSQIKNKEEKKFIKKMQRLYRLPDKRSEAERDGAMMKTLENVM